MKGLHSKCQPLKSPYGGQINPDTNSKDVHALHNSSLYPKRERDCKNKNVIFLFNRGHHYNKVAVLLENVACKSDTGNCFNGRTFEVQWKVTFLCDLICNIMI